MTWWWRIRCDRCMGCGITRVRATSLWIDCPQCGGATFLIESPDGSRRRESTSERMVRERAQLDALERVLGVY